MVKALHAALYPPSLHKSMHLCARRFLSPSGEVSFCLGGLYTGISAHSSALSPESHRLKRSLVYPILCEACAFPALGGEQRTHIGSIKSSFHASSELWKTVLATARERHLDHNGWSSLGIWRTTGTKRAWTSARGGPGFGVGAATAPLTDVARRRRSRSPDCRTEE